MKSDDLPSVFGHLDSRELTVKPVENVLRPVFILLNRRGSFSGVKTKKGLSVLRG